MGIRTLFRHGVEIESAPRRNRVLRTLFRENQSQLPVVVNANQHDIICDTISDMILSDALTRDVILDSTGHLRFTSWGASHLP